MTKFNTLKPAAFIQPLHPLVEGFKLENMLEVLGTQHLLKAARRLSGAKKVQARAEAERLIRETLRDPKQVDALIARLHPTELALLQELKRYDGLANGWSLYVFARLRELNPPSQSMASNSQYLFQDYSGAQYTGASFLWSLMADGLLFPVSVPNPWLTGSVYSYSKQQWQLFAHAPRELVLADPRLLSRLPDTPRLPAPTFAVIQSQGAAPTSAAVQVARLHFAEVLRVVTQHGGIKLTKNGEASKTESKRVLKDLDNLKDPEQWFELVSQLGLLIPDRKGEYLVPFVQGVKELGEMSLTQFATLLLTTLPRLDFAIDTQYNMVNPYTVRACLLELLREVGGPVAEQDFRERAEQVIPSEVRASASRQMFGRSAYHTPQPEGQQKANWEGWLRELLRGPLSEFGLVTIQETSSGTVLIPNPVFAGGLQDVAPNGPAWIVQPNFELMVYPAQLSSAQIRTLGAAEAAALGQQVCTYRLTRESVYAALEGGQTLDGLLAALEAGSATPLAPSVRRSITDWAARRDRVTLYQGVTVLEFATQEKRNIALEKDGGTAVGETLLILDAGKKVAPGTSLIKYGEAPKKVLKFASDGTFTIDGGLDLMVRGALAGQLSQEKRGENTVYRVLPPAAGVTLPSSLLPDLQARATGPLPDLLKTQLAVWTGRAPAPSLAPVTVFQHPQASALAGLPAFKGLLGEALGPGLYAVQPGKEAELAALLAGLGLAPTPQISAPTENLDELLTITDTRKKREYLEQALAAGQSVTIHYHEEKWVDGWYSSKVTEGKLRKGEYLPLSIDRSGNTPYLQAKNLETDTEVKIRIAYIVALRAR